MNMARLTARIVRLETLNGARTSDELAHLSDAELEARICKAAESLTDNWRNRRMSVAAIEAHTGWSADDPRFAALFAEAQAPAFNAARFLAAALGHAVGSDKPES
jgi:hypothetical protein